ncbi:MAG: ATP-binding protein [Acidobacteriota bacterium]|nr:ATP-binding protein [Acidobacteriota bacterium]
MKPLRFRSLTFRLTIWYVVLLGLLVALFLGFSFKHTRNNAREDLDESLRETALRVATLWQRRGVTWEQAVAGVEEESESRRSFILVVEFEAHKNKEPRELARSSSVPTGAFLLDRDLYVQAESSGRDGPLFRTIRGSALAPSPLRVCLLETRDDAVIQVGRTTVRMAGELRNLAILLVLAGTLFLVLASLGGGLIIRKALRPVVGITQAARRITAEDLSLRIQTRRRRDEIGELVETFNAMIARLEESVGRIRQFSADVSHELRTPLTIIRGEIEVLQRKERSHEEYRSVLESTLEEARRMEAIIDDLLLLGRIGASARRALEKVSLADLAARVAEGRKPAAARQEVDLVVTAADPGNVPGDASLLERLLANLVDNAIRYTPPGGRIEVKVEEEDGRPILTVADTGIGIPAESLPRIFDRFYVVDPARCKENGGTGLGLSIVKSVADRHGAMIEVRSETGRGTAFEIRFPRTAAAPASTAPGDTG